MKGQTSTVVLNEREIVTTKICDKCGVESETMVDTWTHRPKEVDVPYWERGGLAANTLAGAYIKNRDQIDLCSTCTAEFLKWLEA